MHSELLHGLFSLGTMFTDRRYPAVPGIDEPYPFPGVSYFSGGYITSRHGSSKGGSVDAIQIECNQDVRFEETARNSFATAAAAIFLDYLIRHYFPDLPDTYCNTAGFELHDNTEFCIYPVPFSSNITVRVSSPVQLNIFNLQCELIISRDVTGEEKINTVGLINGTYLVIMSSGGEVIYRGKIIKGSTR
ncbi:MAG: T9SS type A sorting domain-containing protein [Bacteroidales bacterium]|nr:T9SS type A sorting domain-containing protein [Bacteroidales bacterium]MDT8372597.1 T9SS type A sorting domain-containing protein [Bacteroidales bacterium]